MNLDHFFIFSFEDSLLIAVTFVVCVLISGSLLHLAIVEREYYLWSKQQTEKQVAKRPRKTNAAKKPTKTAKSTKSSRNAMRKARA